MDFGDLVVLGDDPDVAVVHELPEVSSVDVARAFGFVDYGGGLADSGDTSEVATLVEEVCASVVVVGYAD